jgi:hypothetical protein
VSKKKLIYQMQFSRWIPDFRKKKKEPVIFLWFDIYNHRLATSNEPFHVFIEFKTDSKKKNAEIFENFTSKNEKLEKFSKENLRGYKPTKYISEAERLCDFLSKEFKNVPKEIQNNLEGINDIKELLDIVRKTFLLNGYIYNMRGKMLIDALVNYEDSVHQDYTFYRP